MGPQKSSFEHTGKTDIGGRFEDEEYVFSIYYQFHLLWQDTYGMSGHNFLLNNSLDSYFHVGIFMVFIEILFYKPDIEIIIVIVLKHRLSLLARCLISQIVFIWFLRLLWYSHINISHDLRFIGIPGSFFAGEHSLYTHFKNASYGIWWIFDVYVANGLFLAICSINVALIDLVNFTNCEMFILRRWHDFIA